MNTPKLYILVNPLNDQVLSDPMGWDEIHALKNRMFGMMVEFTQPIAKAIDYSVLDQY